MPREHRVTVESACVRTCKRAAVQKVIKRHVVSVRPYTKFWIVIELIAERKRVTVVASRGVRCSGYSNTLQKRRLRDGELGKDPAIGNLVILDNRVAVVGRLAWSGKPRPDGIAGGRSRDNRATALGKDRKFLVHPLHVLGGTYHPVGIGW